MTLQPNMSYSTHSEHNFKADLAYEEWLNTHEEPTENELNAMEISIFSTPHISANTLNYQPKKGA